MGYVRHPLAGKKLAVTPCIYDVTFHIYSLADCQMKWTSGSFHIVAYKIHDVVFPQLKPGFHVTQTSPFSMPDP